VCVVSHATQVRFVEAVISGALVVSNRKRSELLADLHAAGFKRFTKTASKVVVAPVASVPVEVGDASAVDEGGDDEKEEAASSVGYDYLLSMSLWSLTHEKVKYMCELHV
jgi:DNA topoisomerase II